MKKIAKFSYALVHPKANIRAVLEAVAQIWRYRALCRELTKRDLESAFAGQAMGRFWVIGHPLLLYCVYIFIFVFVMKVRIETSGEMPRDYTTYILAGLCPWLSIQQALTRSPTVLLSQANIVKQVVFPIEILPVGSVLVSIVPLLVGIVLLLIRNLYEFSLPVTVLLLPIAILMQVVFMLGLSFLLSVVTPFFRDVKDVVVILTIIGVYIIPAFYLPQWVPSLLRPWLYVNPFSYFVWIYQDALYFGRIDHPYAWLVCAVLSVCSFALGYRTFRMLKPYVANVL